MQQHCEAFFTNLRPGPLGRRLCIWHAPAELPPQALFVHVHALAEEMNKSRRMSAMQSRALAAAGHAVLQFDMLGCGDSDGDSGDATWAEWVEDVVAACAFARQKCAGTWPGSTPPPLWLWGHRAGCLLACQAADRLDGLSGLLFWQPALSGRIVLQQFLRLDSIGAVMGKGAGTARGSAKAALAAGLGAEVAGYTIHPGLALGLEGARLTAPPFATRMEWIDVHPRADSGPSAAAQDALKSWADAGCTVRHHSIVGPAFWQTVEIEEAPGLLEITAVAVAQHLASENAGTARNRIVRQTT